MKSIFKTLPLYLLAIIFLSSCQNDFSKNEENRNIKAFYFPIEELREGKIYEYQSIGNEFDAPFYWYYKTHEMEGSTYLTGMYCDVNFNPSQFIQEEVVGNGMLLSEFYLYETDSTTGQQIQVPVEIQSGNVFPFEVKNPPAVLLSSISWKLPDDTLTTMTFIRNRQFDGDTSFVFKGQNMEAVKFHVRELVDSEREEHLEKEYPVKEIYAKNIGLVYFEKIISDKWQMRYALTNIYDKWTFEEKFKINLPKNLIE